MKKEIIELLKDISDKDLIDVAVQRKLFSKDEVQLRLASDEELMKSFLKMDFEISNGYLFVKADKSVIDELARRHWVYDREIKLCLSDNSLPF